MLTAILTDLHANREAVTACLADADERGAKHFAFLGDLVGYGADPAWVVDTVMAYVQKGALAVRGNHDEAIFIELRQQMHADARLAIEWTREQLNESQRAFLSQLPYQAEQGVCLFVHASACDPPAWEYVNGPLEAIKSLYATSSQITFCGHVHDPALYNLSPTGKLAVFLPRDDSSILLSKHRQWLAVVGSAGQPRDGNPAVCYALFDDVSRGLSFVRVPYDHATAARKIIAAGLPVAFAERLAEGR